MTCDYRTDDLRRMYTARQKLANLRACASCEWIFSMADDCPKCGFAHYGARFVYGDKAYRYAKTQEPWMRKKLSRYEAELRREIAESSLEAL